MDKKQKNCEPSDPDDDHCGDYWDVVAYDPEHRLVLIVVPGARSLENAEITVEETKARLGDEPLLMTSDEFAKYIENEIVKWGRVVKEGNIRAQ